jgi:uncharacterized protein YbcI
MNDAPTTIAEQLAAVASSLQHQRSGHLPRSVTVVLSEDTLVVTLHGALSPVEKDLARTPAGASQVQDYHRQLFANSDDDMRQEIKRITGRQVREASAEIEVATGAVIHAFTTGAMVQIFLLANGHSRRVDQENAPLDGSPDGELLAETPLDLERRTEFESKPY